MKAVVTGGVGVLGSAVAAALAEAGHEVVVTAAGPEEAARWTGPGRAEVVDLRDPAAVEAFAARVGAIDALACCAGGFSMQALGELEPEALRSLVDLNLVTAAHTLSAFAERLNPGAGVVLVGARTWRGAAGVAAYAATKAAVVSLARSAALEWKPRRVHVNAILPDLIDTPANRRAMPDADFDRWAKPAELAAVIRWLCSPEAFVVSGNAIEVGR